MNGVGKTGCVSKELSRSLEVDDGYTVHITTDGNFSTLETEREALLPHRFLRNLFCRFEEQFNLRITNWQIWNLEQYGMRILINHEPKEKIKVVHLPEFEPDIGL